MKARLRAAALRYWPRVYCAVIGLGAGLALRQPRWPVPAKIEVTLASFLAVCWYLGWRAELAHRRLLEQRIRELTAPASALPKGQARPTADFVVPRQYWPN